MKSESEMDPCETNEENAESRDFKKEIAEDSRLDKSEPSDNVNGDQSLCKRKMQWPSEEKSIEGETSKRQRTEKHNKSPDRLIKESNACEEEVYSLTIANLPNYWTYAKVTDFIEAKCGKIKQFHIIKSKKPEMGLSVTVMCKSKEQVDKAIIDLWDKEIEGRTLTVDTSNKMDVDSDADSDTTLVIKSNVSTEENIHSPWKAELDMWSNDPLGLYGLRPEYLESLEIVPPINKWVFVSNFRCDKTELREVMELAGQVVVCAVTVAPNKFARVMYSHPLEAVQFRCDKTELREVMELAGQVVVCAVTVAPNKFARVMYSHPLEAVQAVSMLNGQYLYGIQLKVQMNPVIDKSIWLPKGLKAVGPGLGQDGKVLRDVVKQYERHLVGYTSKINLSLFQPKDRESNRLVKADETKTSVADSSLIGPIAQKADRVDRPNEFKSTPSGNFSPSGPFPRSNTMMPVGPRFPTMPGPIRGPVPMPMSRPQVPFNGPFMPGTGPRPQMRPGPMVNTMAPGPPVVAGLPGPAGPIGPPGLVRPYVDPTCPQIFRGKDPVTVQLTNLPLNTTFASLCGRISEIGHVVSLEFTTPGCAVVKFSNPSEAERCFHTVKSGKIN